MELDHVVGLAGLAILIICWYLAARSEEKSMPYRWECLADGCHFKIKSDDEDLIKAIKKAHAEQEVLCGRTTRPSG